MQSAELRKAFLDFFEHHGHARVPSSSLIPDDPSVLLTTAGMQQFKPYYTAVADPLYSPHPALGGKPLGSKNAASAQKSFRTSDIEEVGDERHLTFFEMLGNFSFGGYFKKEAITLTKDFLDSIRITIDYVTVFQGDETVPQDAESIALWKEYGFSQEKGNLRLMGRADNFWGPTGNEGPCGPTTEIYAGGIEIWNIVFNEYYCHTDGSLEKLQNPGVDTGMGLERLAMVSQGTENVFQTDLFVAPFGPVAAGGKSLRVIADHVRAATFLLADGVRPSNKEAGYVLRRLIRRMLIHAKREDLSEANIQAFMENVISYYGAFYAELRTERETILQEFTMEAGRFAQTLEKGLKEFDKRYPIQSVATDRHAVSGKTVGKEAFDLYQTYGFPIEVIRELLEERLYVFDEQEFKAKTAEELHKHQEISRAGQEKKFGGHGLLLDTGELKAANEEELQKVTRLHTATHLLQAALRKVLGNDVHQAGSDITVERTRFDFTFPRKLTQEELSRVEALVNEAIRTELVMGCAEMQYQEAVASGALYSPREKYPAVVKVYSFRSAGSVFSSELCGGPHVANTKELGAFRIIKEEASSAGIRRIRAVLLQ